MKQIWHYLLEKGLWGATLLIWGISVVVYVVAMGILWVIMKKL